MPLSEILEWIARYPGHAFITGCFILVGLGILCDFIIRFVRSLTGMYPPAPVSRLCDEDDPCYCCQEGECDPDCRCSSEDDEA